jgi:hypothetical protein
MTAAAIWSSSRLRPGAGGVVLSATALCIALAVEWAALAAGRWSYSERMIVVPVLGVGLWPLLQMALLAPAAAAAGGWLQREGTTREKEPVRGRPPSGER